MQALQVINEVLDFVSYAVAVAAVVFGVYYTIKYHELKAEIRKFDNVFHADHRVNAESKIMAYESRLKKNPKSKTVSRWEKDCDAQEMAINRLWTMFHNVFEWLRG